MSKYLNILAPALGGTALMLGGAYLSAYVINAPEPMVSAARATAGGPDSNMGDAPPVALVPEVAKAPTASATGSRFGLGRPASEDEIAAWNVDVQPDGTGLPPGSGDVMSGEELFSENCAICHGEFAEGVDNWPELAGGEGSLADKDPVKTVGSYWPYLSTTWDYVHRSMPFGNAQSLETDDVYAIVAYILYSNYLVEDDFVLSNENFLDVAMPNADGFIVDDRDTSEAHFWNADPCMENCKDTVEITMRARVLDVTPQEAGEDQAANTAPDATPAAVPAEPAEPAEAATQEADEAAGPSPELIAAGEKAFKKCKACHQVGEGAKNKTGPALNGIVGAPAGASAGFKYSGALNDAAQGGLVWSPEELTAFLSKPKTYMKGTKMSFAGFKKESDIAAVIAYLSSFPAD